MLGQIEVDGRVVVADFEAGIGTLSRMKPGQLDVLLVVTEPTVKALEVARRAVDMIGERGLGTPHLVANRVMGDEDRAQVEGVFAGAPVTIVPDDPAVRAADARGVAPFDAAHDAPAVRAIGALADALVG